MAVVGRPVGRVPLQSVRKKRVQEILLQLAVHEKTRDIAQHIPFQQGLMRVHATLQRTGKGVARLHWGLSCPSSAVHAEILGGHTAALSCGFHLPMQQKQSTHGLVAMT